MRKFTSGEKAIIKRIIKLHKEHINTRIPVPVIYEKNIEFKVGDYEQCRKEAIQSIVINHNHSYIYETANLINVLEENGYLLLDKEYDKNLYQEEIRTYTNYIKEIESFGWQHEETDGDAFPLKSLFGRISPKFANILLNQIYANALIFDSLIELADDDFLTEEGQMLKQAQTQSQYAEASVKEAQKQTQEALSQTKIANESLNEAIKQTKNAQSQTTIAQATLKEAQEQTSEAKKQTDFASNTFKAAKRTNWLSLAMLIVSTVALIVAFITMIITAKSLKNNSYNYYQATSKEQLLKEKSSLIQDSIPIIKSEDNKILKE